MTTASWSTRVRHDSDAVFREWRDEFITKLGLMTTLAADETNITPGAGTMPAANTEQGYAVYHLNDSLHGTAPIYIRFGFGTGSSQCPRIQVTTGTSTNGSGVLGGTALSTIASIHGNATQTSDTARISYMCCVEGFFGVSWKVGSGSTDAAFFICRTCDSDGVPTVTGSLAHWGGGSTTGFTKRQAFRYAATAAAYTATTSSANGLLGFSPQSPVNTTIGSDIQVFLGWTRSPGATPLFGVCGVYPAELPVGTSFTATIVGSTPRTYLTMGYNGSGPFDSNNLVYTAMLWE